MKKFSGTLIRSARRIAYGTVDRVAFGPSRLIRQVLRDTRAVTSIEFAAIALPFFTLVIGTMALGLWFFCAAALDVAVYRAGRLIQTGQIEANLTSKGSGSFADQYICPILRTPTKIISCGYNNPVVCMAVVDDFSNMLNKRPIRLLPTPIYAYSLKTLTCGGNFCVPGAGSIVYLQAIYTMPILNSVITFFGGGPLMSGTTVQVEQTPGAPSNTCTAIGALP